MNELRNKYAALMAETFHGDWENGPAANFARAAARSARRSRLRRRLAAGAIGCACAIGLVVSSWPRPVAPARPEKVARARGYEIISDAELLAVLRDRPLVMLEQPDGRKEFVTFGQ